MKLLTHSGLGSNELYVEYDGERYRLFMNQSDARLWYLYEPIEWMRVDEDEDDIALYSKMILDYKPYNPNIMKSFDGEDKWCTILHPGRPANTYNGSLIDLWLNIDFVEDTFGILNQNRDF